MQAGPTFEWSFVNCVQDCGATLYGDFNCSDLREVDKLGRELQATGYEDEVQDDHGIKMVLTSQEQSDSSDPIGLGSQRSSAAQSAPAPHTNTNVSHSFLRDPNGALWTNKVLVYTGLI